MTFLKRQAAHSEKAPPPTGGGGVAENTDHEQALTSEQRVTFQAIFLGSVASIGGFMFGYVR
jgi:hypothetical protein